MAPSPPLVASLVVVVVTRAMPSLAEANTRPEGGRVFARRAQRLRRPSRQTYL
ncbi:hypothetical protein [Mycobacterium celatum]|uniref:hypothetical protein n=1 Tax=Mycobacterium celatum TaxID=28045 RepID=UPI0012EE9ED6|nr:hypothetical protein [Mycobacterium celatum]